MARTRPALLLAPTLLLLLLLASPAPADAANRAGRRQKKKASRNAITQGDATWYTGIYNGFCGFGSAGLPADRFIAAVRADSSQGPPIGGACGECLAVWCRPAYVSDAYGSFNLDRTTHCQSSTEGIVVRTTDICPCQGNEQWCCGRGLGGVPKNHLDLSQEAFRALIKNGEVDLGILGIEWAPVSCSLLGQRVTREGTVSLPAPAPAPVQAPPPVPAPIPAQVTPPPPAPPVPTPAPAPAPTPAPQVTTAEQRPPPAPTTATPTRPQRPTTPTATSRPPPPPPAKPVVAPSAVRPPRPPPSPPKPLTASTSGSISVQQACASQGACPAAAANNPTAAFAAAAQALCPSDGLWEQAKASGVPLALGREVLEKHEQCGGAGAACCAYARQTAGGSRASPSCADKPFAGRRCVEGTTCSRVNAWYYQCV